MRRFRPSTATWGGLVGGALALIALEAFTRGKGPEQGGRLIGWIATGIEAAMSPDVALIPRTGKSTAKATKPSTQSTPGGISGPLGISRNPTVQV